MSDDFDWTEVSKDEVIVKPARETIVYLNTDGNIVIRARRDEPFESEDSFVVIPKDRVRALIDRLDVLQLEADANYRPFTAGYT